jgi:hypothetical protein
LPQLLTTALRTELGTTLMIGVLTTHHCHNGLLPSLLAPSQDAEMAWQNTSSFPLCPDHRPGPTLMRKRDANNIRSRGYRHVLRAVDRVTQWAKRGWSGSIEWPSATAGACVNCSSAPASFPKNTNSLAAVSVPPQESPRMNSSPLVARCSVLVQHCPDVMPNHLKWQGLKTSHTNRVVFEWQILAD